MQEGVRERVSAEQQKARGMVSRGPGLPVPGYEPIALLVTARASAVASEP